jgi:hypothetical protein
VTGRDIAAVAVAAFVGGLTLGPLALAAALYLLKRSAPDPWLYQPTSPPPPVPDTVPIDLVTYRHPGETS